MRTWPTLYKEDTTGKTRMWSIRVDDDNGVPYYEVEHGVDGGQLVSSRTHFRAGKNIGRSNETTPLEQAESEAQSLWEKKQNRNAYHTQKKQQVVFKGPMLAKSYNAPGPDLSSLKDGKHIKFPCYYQPKLDGIRCIASKSQHAPDYGVVLRSRQNKVFTSLDHVEKALRSCFFSANIRLDGELYIHDEEFQELTSAIKRDKPTEASAKIEYHIYDMYDWSKPNMSFKERNEWLRAKITPGDTLKLVETGLITDVQQIRKQLKRLVGDGYEGIMLRNIEGPYKVGGRSKDLQKVKLFIDMEFPIVDAYENRGKMEGQCTFLCETSDGYTFGVKPEGSDAIRRQYWTDWKAGKLNGKLLTVRFFAWTTSKEPVPRFPVGVEIRDTYE